MDCIIGLYAYNSQIKLPFLLNNIIRLKTIFNNIILIISYDKSTDNTLNLLNEINIPGVTVNIINFVNKVYGLQRTKRYADARNLILDEIRLNYSNIPYFIMLDINEYTIDTKIDTELLTNILTRDDWDAISFTRSTGFSDIFSLSYDPYVYSILHFNNWNKVAEIVRKDINDLILDYRMNKPNELIPVLSVFNGFIIYRTNLFINSVYSSDIDISLFPENSIENEIKLVDKTIVSHLINDNEHRLFNLKSIKENNVRIRLCPKFLMI
jgi:hypothetical protein